MGNFFYYQHMRNLAVKGEPRALKVLLTPGDVGLVFAFSLYALAMYEVETSTAVLDDKAMVVVTLTRHYKKIEEYVRALTFMWLDGSFEFSREFPFTKEDLHKLVSRGKNA